jgi:hypothetical protein
VYMYVSGQRCVACSPAGGSKSDLSTSTLIALGMFACWFKRVWSGCVETGRLLTTSKQMERVTGETAFLQTSGDLRLVARVTASMVVVGVRMLVEGRLHDATTDLVQLVSEEHKASGLWFFLTADEAYPADSTRYMCTDNGADSAVQCLPIVRLR